MSRSESLLDVAPVIPVVVLDRVEDAVPLGRALVEGGLPIIEVTLRTPAALDGIRALAAEVPEILVGAGTVLSPSLAADAVAAGAGFLVSPGATPALIDGLRASGVPFLPGAATVSEVLTLVEQGITDLKFFPAEASGGAAFLGSLRTVVPAARFCPTGGITVATAPTYLALSNVGCVGGSWLTPGDLVARGDWDGVRRLAAEAAQLG